MWPSFLVLLATMLSLCAASGTTAQSSSGYLVASYYSSSGSCSPEADYSFAFAFDACLVGTSANGNPVTAMKYVVDKVESNLVHVTVNNYDGSDCSTTPKTYTTVYSLSCMHSGTTSMRYAYVPATSTAWKDFSHGLVVQSYYQGNTCSSPPEVWTTLGFNYCTPIYDKDSNVQSIKYTSCTPTTYTENKYADPTCTKLVSSTQHPLPSCAKADASKASETMLCHN